MRMKTIGPTRLIAHNPGRKAPTEKMAVIPINPIPASPHRVRPAMKSPTERVPALTTRNDSPTASFCPSAASVSSAANSTSVIFSRAVPEKIATDSDGASAVVNESGSEMRAGSSTPAS